MRLTVTLGTLFEGRRPSVCAIVAAEMTSLAPSIVPGLLWNVADTSTPTCGTEYAPRPLNCVWKPVADGIAAISKANQAGSQEAEGKEEHPRPAGVTNRARAVRVTRQA
jgi:hypothetical protein